MIVIFLVSCHLWGLNEKKFANHLREALSLDTRTNIEIANIKDSGVGNMKEAEVRMTGRINVTRKIFISPDNNFYIWGEAFDVRKSPDEERASKLKLDDVHAKGSPGAPVTIVEFTDLQCPHCKNAHGMLGTELYKAYDKDQVQWVFKHFPLNYHKWALKASLAAECAADQKPEAFFPMIDSFFEASQEMTEEKVKSAAIGYAKEHKLDTKALARCIDDQALMEKVEADKKEGAEAGVSSTPTLFINGRMMRGFRSFEDVTVIIDEKLKEAK